ncbi:MAG: hypothetical protein LBQ26_00885 [Holosporales bacterium]|jgi:hypothetical protein|nr:hypothetical protein [Holosporales bacterium]
MITLQSLIADEKKRIPVFFHPARVMCVGFEEAFFKALQSDLHPQDTIILESCRSMVASLFLLNRAYRKHDPPQNTVCSSADEVFAFCRQKIASPERFRRFSTMVISSRPSIEETLLHIEHVQDWRIKKILIAEPNESAIALEALYMHLVDALLFSRAPQLTTRILEVIRRLQWQYFLDCAGVCLRPEQDPPHKPAYSSAALHAGLSEFLGANPSIVEFYQLDRQGAYLLLTESGMPSVLFFDQAPWPIVLKKEEETLRCVRRHRLQTREQWTPIFGNVVEDASLITLPHDKIVSFFEAKQHPVEVKRH